MVAKPPAITYDAAVIALRPFVATLTKYPLPGTDKDFERVVWTLSVVYRYDHARIRTDLTIDTRPDVIWPPDRDQYGNHIRNEDGTYVVDKMTGKAAHDEQGFLKQGAVV